MTENMMEMNVHEETQTEVKEEIKTEVKEEVKEIVPEVYDETGVIGASTKVMGDITTKGHLEIQGSVNGNIEAKGNILVSGNVIGKMKCGNLLIQSGNIKSEVEVGNLVSIKEGAALTGKITCQDITVAGVVNGDIVASGKVGLASTAVVKGNITAGAMGMELGAKLCGSMCIE